MTAPEIEKNEVVRMSRAFINAVLLIILVAFLSGCTNSPSPVCGNGTCEPQSISDCVELQSIKDSNHFSFSLIKDIDCSETKNWNGGKGFEPIDLNRNFEVFNGNSHKIIGLTINRPDEEGVGLFNIRKCDNFCRVTRSTISDVNLIDVNIVGSENVGALIGSSIFTFVKNVSVTGSVKGNYKVGGVIGNSNAEDRLSQISFDGFVDGTRAVGGIAGHFTGTIDSSRSNGSVDGLVSVGGIAGVVDEGFCNSRSISCGAPRIDKTNSNVEIRGASHVGGIIGTMGFGFIFDSNFSGAMLSGSNSGGMVGVCEGCNLVNPITKPRKMEFGLKEDLEFLTDCFEDNSCKEDTRTIPELNTFNRYNPFYGEIWLGINHGSVIGVNYGGTIQHEYGGQIDSALPICGYEIPYVFDSNKGEYRDNLDNGCGAQDSRWQVN